jgi:hypothetical protein
MHFLSTNIAIAGLAVAVVGLIFQIMTYRRGK